MKTNIKTRAWLLTSLAALLLAFHPAPNSEFSAHVYGEINNDTGIAGTLPDAAMLTTEPRDGGDFSLDFVASAPATYDHNIGGGAFDDRTVGTANDIVESLEGSDFACGDIVTYLTQITVDDTPPAGLIQTIRIDYEFTADNNGQPGIGLIEILNVAVNYGSVVGGDGAGGTDSGIVDDGGSVATLISQSLSAPIFTSSSILEGIVEVTDLEVSETVVIRIDVLLGCDPGSNPTGTMQAKLADARTIDPVEDDITGGAQTVPFNSLGDVPLALIATKTVETSLTRTYDWTIDKSVSPASWDLFTGDDATSEYTVSLDKTGFTDSGWTVNGVISIENPSDNSETATIESVADQISPDIVATVDCGLVTFPHLLAPGATLECDYTASVPDATDRTNSILVGTSGSVGTGLYAPVDVSFSDPMISEVNGSVNVSDPNDASSPRGPFTDDGSFSYEKTFTCADKGQNGNTATIVETQQTDDANVAVTCYDLEVVKTVSTSLTRTYSWTIDKTAQDETLLLSPGQIFIEPYAVEVDAMSEDSDWAVSGTIKISNLHPTRTATLTEVTDKLTADGLADVSASVNCPALTVASSGTLECTYSSDMPDGDGRSNTATARLQNTSLDKAGTDTNAGTSDFSGSEDVAYDAATVTEIDECIDVTDTLAGDLGSACTDETLPKTFNYNVDIGPFEDPANCGENQVDNTASFTTNDNSATGSDGHSIVVTIPCDNGCTLTQGYWKTHNESFWGGAPVDDNWANLSGEKEETAFFSSGQTYFDVLWTSPAGNAYYNLAHQYIAAELNGLNDASLDDVQEDFDEATALFEAYTPEDVKTLKGKDRKAFIDLAETLTEYNEGVIGPGHCSEDETSETEGDAEESTASIESVEPAKLDEKQIVVEQDAAEQPEAEPTENIQSEPEIPTSFELDNYPNPFNPSTTMKLSIPEQSEVRVAVYDIVGRQVQQLVDGVLTAGVHEVIFEAGELPSGIYLIRMLTPVGTFTHEVLLTK